MFRFLCPQKREVDTGETLECPVCHRLLRLIRLNPNGKHRLKELEELVEKVKGAELDLTLPDDEWIKKVKKEADHSFNKAIRKETR